MTNESNGIRSLNKMNANKPKQNICEHCGKNLDEQPLLTNANIYEAMASIHVPNGVNCIGYRHKVEMDELDAMLRSYAMKQNKAMK